MSPIQLLLTRRLLLAKQLLTETRLPVTRDRLRQRLLEPAPLQRRLQIPLPHAADTSAQEGDSMAGHTATRRQTSTLQLSYRPPYDWDGLLAFLKARELKGVEWVGDDFYARTVHLGAAKGWIRVTRSAKKHALLLEFTHTLTPVLPALLRRQRDCSI